MPIPLIVYGAVAGAGALGFGGWAISSNIAETAKATAEPAKKAIKMAGLAGGAFYARKVAKTTNSPTIKRIANLATLGAVFLIGREAITGKSGKTTTELEEMTPSERMEAEGSFWE